MKYIAPLLFALSLGVFGTNLSDQVSANLSIYHSESDFLNVAPIVSTETFDEFPSRTTFFSPQVVIDQVVYEVDGPCITDEQPNPCWVVGIQLGPGSVTPPHDFGSTLPNGNEHRISFGTGRAVRAFGFWFLSGAILPPPHWEVIVNEIDGTSTTETVQLVSGQQYLGFVSDIGISTLIVRGVDPLGAAPWSYDNVSRSLIFSLEDSDDDGVSDDEDRCLDSDLSTTVVIDSCDSGVPNTLFTSGCTISDSIADCAEDARNHGRFVSCVSDLTNNLKKAGTITGQQKGTIQSCAGQASIP